MSFEELFGLSLLVFHIVIGDCGGQSNSLGLQILVLHLLAEFLEQSLEQLFLVVHNLDNWRLYLGIPKNKIFLGSLSCLKGFSECHLSKHGIVFIKTFDHLVLIHFNFFVVRIISRADEIT